MPRRSAEAPLGRTLLLAAAVLASACASGSDEPTASTVTDSAGVTIVTEPSATDVPLSLTVDTSFTLGGKETPEESFYELGSPYVDTDADGSIYVLDRTGHQVQVFDSTGAHVRTLGREGDGPGELQMPSGIAVAPDGELWVADVVKRTTVHWGARGALLDPGRIPGLYSYRGGLLKWTPDGLLFPVRDTVRHALMRPAETGPEDDVDLLTIPVSETAEMDLQSCGMRLRGLPPIFAPEPIWNASGDTLVWTRGPEYVIDVYVEHRLVMSVRRSIAPRAATFDLAVESLNGGIRIGTPRGTTPLCEPDEWAEEQGFADFVPSVGAVVLSPEGTLWVQRYEVGERPRAIDLFEPDGEYMGTLPPGTSFPMGFLPDGRALVSERDEFDVMRLAIVRMRFGAS